MTNPIIKQRDSIIDQLKKEIEELLQTKTTS